MSSSNSSRSSRQLLDDGRSDDGSSSSESFISDEENDFDYYDDVPDCEITGLRELHIVRENRTDKTELLLNTTAEDEYDFRWNEEFWEGLGRDIAGNEYLTKIEIRSGHHTLVGALNDQGMTSLFRQWTRSNSIRDLSLTYHRFGDVGVQAMVPFLQNSRNLTELDVNRSNMTSEGFRLLCRALHDSPIEWLGCAWCGVDSIEIENGYIPKRLETLTLHGNKINADGCRGLAELLRVEDSTLKRLHVAQIKIDDEGVAILCNALRKNTSLEYLFLENNEEITEKGQILMLKLVNDISSIKATLQSNHTLVHFGSSFHDMYVYGEESPEDIIRYKITRALEINMSRKRRNDPAAAREKVISTQLDSNERISMCHLQEVDKCNEALYSEINPLHLPEVLAIVGRVYGQEELYVALSSSIMGLFSTVNKKKFLQERLTYHMAIIQEHAATAEKLRAEIAAIEEAEENLLETENESECLGIKR